MVLIEEPMSSTETLLQSLQSDSPTAMGRRGSNLLKFTASPKAFEHRRSEQISKLQEVQPQSGITSDSELREGRRKPHNRCRQPGDA